MATWDAADYAKNSQGQYHWALGNLDKLGLTGNETVLDIGCGDGKISVEIARRVPRGHVTGIDQSAKMIALARSLFQVQNLDFHVQDAQAMEFRRAFDRVFSNSAIHWMPNPQSVVRGIAHALRPGGRIFLSMGGRSTAALARRAIEELMASSRWSPYLAGASAPHFFLGPEEYVPWLIDAGLRANRAELVHKPMHLGNAAALEGWLRTTWMAYWERLPDEEREPFLQEFTRRVGSGCEVAADGSLMMPMVNLEIEASSPGAD